MASFAHTAQSALDGSLSDAALELVLDTAARRRDPVVAAHALERAAAREARVQHRLWSHSYAARALLAQPHALNEVGHFLLAQTVVSAGTNLLDALDARAARSTSDEEPRASGALVVRALIPMVTDLLLGKDFEEKPAPSDEERAALSALAARLASRDRLVELFATPSRRPHLPTLARCLPDKEGWLRTLLPTLDPLNFPDAELLVALTDLDDVPLEVWGCLRWATLRAGSAGDAGYAARLFDAAAVQLSSDAEREAFAVLSEDWTGTVNDLVAACRAV